MRRLLLAAVLLTVAAVPTASAAAAVKHPQADAAMRKGIRDVARVSAGGAKASRIHVACPPVAQVDDKRTCQGTFRLTKDGRSADYALTARNHVLRISKGAIEYRVVARAAAKVRGLPATVDLAGFLQ